MVLKGQCHEIFDFRLFSWTSSPKPLSIPLKLFRIFSQSREDIRSSRCNKGVVDTGGKGKKSSITKVLITLLGHLWVVQLTYRYIFPPSLLLGVSSLILFPLFATGVKDTSCTFGFYLYLKLYSFPNKKTFVSGIVKSVKVTIRWGGTNEFFLMPHLWWRRRCWSAGSHTDTCWSPAAI
jgi:hypothetical protein